MQFVIWVSVFQNWRDESKDYLNLLWLSNLIFKVIHLVSKCCLRHWGSREHETDKSLVGKDQ